MIRLENNILAKSASYLAVFISSSILIIKIYGWLITESQSMLASLVDTALDISSSSVNLIALTISLRPPDNNHRFGHEKFQDLAIFSQSIFFFASSIFTLISSTKALFYGNVIENTQAGAQLMYICIVLVLILICYQEYVVRKTRSRIIAIDKMHYFSDLLTNFVVIGCMHFSTNLWYIDSVCGILISLYILFMSFKFFKEAIKNLADEELSKEEKQKILAVLAKYQEIKGVHELKTRYAGSKPFIQCHLEMDGNTSLFEANKLNDTICEELLTIFKGGEVTLHQEPEGVDKKANYRENIRAI